VTATYFTPHDLAPVGDLVWYVSTNLDDAHRQPRAEHHHSHLHSGLPHLRRLESLLVRRRGAAGHPAETVRLSGPHRAPDAVLTAGGGEPGASSPPPATGNGLSHGRKPANPPACVPTVRQTVPSKPSAWAAAPPATPALA